MAKAKKDDSRFLGAETHYGYERIDDGTFRVAPILCDSFQELFDEQEAIQELMESTQRYSQNRLTVIVKRRRELFDRVFKDCGVSRDTHSGTFNRAGVITFKLIPKTDDGE